MTVPRSQALEQLGAATFDLAVIGAGIVGARIAYEAAIAGLRVALVDAGDFGGATSSVSSKFIHGGLRYFTRGHLRLVRAAQLEKRSLTQRVAPGLVWRQPLVVAVTRQGVSNPLAARAALGAFWALSSFARPRPRVIPEREASRVAPSMRVGGAATYLLMEESSTDDSRLTLATVASAARAGASVANYVRVRGLSRAAGRWSIDADGRSGEGHLTIAARAVVNAAGPWVDEIRALERPGRAPLVRLSKGVHAVLPLDGPWGAAISVHAPLVRNVFALPWQGLLLLGTTDDLYEGRPEEVRVTGADLDVLFNDAASFLAPAALRPDRVLSTFAGLRALPLSADKTSDAPREHVLDVSENGLVSVAGGKMTTHRLIAIDALRSLPAPVRPRTTRPTDARLDRAVPLDRYAGLPDAGLPIHPAGRETWAVVHRAVEHEWALTEDDVLRRRTTLTLRGLVTEEIRRGVRAVLEG